VGFSCTSPSSSEAVTGRGVEDEEAAGCLAGKKEGSQAELHLRVRRYFRSCADEHSMLDGGWE